MFPTPFAQSLFQRPQLIIIKETTKEFPKDQKSGISFLSMNLVTLLNMAIIGPLSASRFLKVRVAK